MSSFLVCVYLYVKNPNTIDCLPASSMNTSSLNLLPKLVRANRLRSSHTMAPQPAVPLTCITHLAQTREAPQTPPSPPRGTGSSVLSLKIGQTKRSMQVHPNSSHKKRGRNQTRLHQTLTVTSKTHILIQRRRTNLRSRAYPGQGVDRKGSSRHRRLRFQGPTQPKRVIRKLVNNSDHRSPQLTEYQGCAIEKQGVCQPWHPH